MIVVFKGKKNSKFPHKAPAPPHQWRKRKEHAGVELCQAQGKLGVIVYIGVKVEVEIVVEV